MSQNQSSAGSLWMGILPNLMSPNFAAMCKKSAENCSAMQKEWMETLEHANRNWVARLEAEAKLSSDFAARVVSAKAIPEAAAAYQEWMTRRMELLSKEWQKALEDGQKFVNACTRIAGNGKGFGGS
jgi:Phasin protein